MKNFKPLFLAICFFALFNFSGCSFFENKEDKLKKLQVKSERYIKENKFEEARISLLSAIKLQPKNAEMNYQLAEVMIKLKKFKQGAQYYRQAIDLNPEHRKANLHLAALYLVASQLELAESHVDKVLSTDENDQDALAILANLFAKRKNFKQADEVLDKILTLSPKNITALAGKADVSLANNDFPAAEKFLRQAYEIDPTSSPIQLALVDFYVKLGRSKEAEDLLNNLVTKNPKNSTLRYYYGEYLLTKGSAADAVEHFEQTLVQNPKNYKVRDRLFDLYLFQERIEDAKELLAKLEATNPKDPSINYFKGRVADLNKEPEKASEFYQSSVNELRSFAPAFRRAGMSDIRQGNNSEGISNLEKAIAINQYDVGARLSLAQYYFKLKNYANASEHVRKVLEKFPNQAGANTLRADIALIQNDLESAEKVYQSMIKNYPASPSGFIKMGLLSEKKRDSEGALRNYRTAIEKDIGVWTPLKRFIPLSIKKVGAEETKKIVNSFLNSSTKSKAAFNVALAQLELSSTKSKEEALSKKDLIKNYLNNAIKEDPNFLPTYPLLAKFDSLSGNTAASVNSYRTLVEKKPNNKSYRLLLAMNLEKGLNFEEAIKEYKKVLEIDPRFGPAANNLAWLLSEKAVKEGENSPLHDEALSLAQIAKEEMPKQSAVTDTLGWIYHRKGSNRLALATLEEAISLEEKSGSGKVNPEILLHLAKVHEALDNKDMSLKTYKRVLEEVSKIGGGLSEVEINEIKSKIANFS